MTVPVGSSVGSSVGNIPPELLKQAKDSNMPPEMLLQLLMRQKQDKELAEWAINQFRTAKNLRTNIERQWYLNLSFYYGKQYVKFVGSGLPTSSMAMVTPKAPPWRVRLVVNRIRPIIRTEIAKLTAQRPTAYVVPASNEEQDKSAAKAAEQIWNSAYRDYNVHKLLRRSLWWGTICGNSYLKVYWDKNADEGMGAVKMEVISPFHILTPDLTIEDIEDQPFIIHSSLKSKDEVKREYGVNPTSTASKDTIMETSFLNIIDSPSTVKDAVLCHEIWIKPGGHKYFPKGGLLTVVGEQIVQRKDEYPYPHKMYPFAKFDHVQTGQYYSDSVVTDLIPLQRELNKARSQIIEAKNLMSKPQLMAPKGSVDPRKITSEPGQVVQYTPGLPPPQPLPIQPLPAYVLQEVDRLVQDMDDVSGQHEISRGQNPSQVTAFSALNYLQDQDESKLAASVASVEEFIEKVAQLYLKYVVYFWTMPRTVRTVGRDKIVDAAIWKGSDIQGNTDIRVESGSAIPLGKQQKQSFLLDLFKLGAIDPSMLLELLEMNDIQDANEEFLVDKHQAMRENMVMMEKGVMLDPSIFQPQASPVTGLPMPPQIPQEFLPHSYDNHEAHIQYHNSYRKSQEFDVAPDNVKMLFEHHVMLHQQALMMGVSMMGASGEPQAPVGGMDASAGGDAENPQEQAMPTEETDTPSTTQPNGQGN